MICEKCVVFGKQLAEALSHRERVFLMAATASMMRSIHKSSIPNPEDVMVGSSVTTKLLLSFSADQRSTLLDQIKAATGYQIKLGACPHQLKIVPGVQ